MTIGKRRGFIFAITFILLAFLSCAVGLTVQKAAYAEESSVVYIDTESDLIALSESVNAGNSRLGEKFVLTANLDLTKTEYADKFEPIGKNTAFHGAIDGNGHTVTLALEPEDNSSSAFVGKLGTSGSITRITISGSIKGKSLVAGIAAENEGNISYCVVDATFTNDGTNGSNNSTGGVAANNDGSIVSCVCLSDITAPINVGGIAGVCGGTIDDSVFLGTIYASGTASMKIGGLVGALAGTMKDSFTRSSINLAVPDNADKSSIGSVAGTTGGSKTTNNYAVADEYSFPAGGGKDEEGQYERKSLYDFLSENGVELGDSFVRADYAVGGGYLYAPEFLTKTDGEKIEFIDEKTKKAFSASLFTSGEGTEENPWIIGENKQWAVSGEECWTLFKTNASIYDYEGKFIRCDVDVDVGYNHSVGSAAVPFAGNFDGGNKTFTLSGDGYADDTALFAYVGGNAAIKNFTASGKGVSGGNSVAAAVANADENAKISNVINRCPVTGETNVGGIVGKISSEAVTVENCVNYARISGVGGNGTGAIGGVVGLAEKGATMRGLANYGEITALYGGTSDVGGVVGRIDEINNEISALHGESTITATRTENVGGVIGSVTINGEKTIASLGAVGSVAGKRYVGGIIGKINVLSGSLKTEVFASLTELSGENRVSGIANVDGTAEFVAGYFTGTITERKGEGTAEFICDPIATASDKNSVLTSEVYYNTDDGNKSTAIVSASGKNTIQLTDGKLFDERMEKIAPSLTKGTYPFPKSTRAYLNREERLDAAYFDGEETGESGTVYLISSEKALRNLSFFTRTNVAGYAEKRYKLASDVTMTREFEPIKDFVGEFDGNEKTINALTITSGNEFVGLFDVLKSGATVKNLGLKNGRITATAAAATVGAICGKAEEGSLVEGIAADVTVQGKGKVLGGLIGYGNKTVVRKSFFASKILSEGNAVAGGIAGESIDSSIGDCFFVGKIINCTISGGIVGKATKTDVEGCYASGRIEGQKAGGIVGEIDGGKIARAFVIADIFYNDEAGKGAIYGVSVSKPTTAECYYNSDSIKLGAYDGIDAESNKEFAKITDFFTVDGPGNFLVSGFAATESDLNESCDALYTHYLTAFSEFIAGADNSTYEQTVAFYVRKSVEIAIFGTNTASDETAGSELNPYIVDNAQRFAKISELVRRTDFADKFFKIPCDIDMNAVTSMRAVGYYSLAVEKPFSGTIYGEKADGTRPRISNVRITEATDGTTVTTSYLGVFACTGEGFTVRNLIFDGKVGGNTEVAGLVGYMHKGRVQNVWSKIDVTASGEKASGLISTVSSSAEITGSVCSGEVNATGSVYGIVGVAKSGAGITVDATASWFVARGEMQTDYTHNNVGSVLFDFSDESKGERLEIIDGASKGFGFRPVFASDSKYKGKILNATDAAIFSSDNVNAYFDTTTEDVTRTFSVRYCAFITVNVRYGDGTGTDYAAAQASGEYYIGQTVTASLGFTDKGKALGTKFVGLSDKNGDEYEYELVPSAGQVLVSFIMSEKTEEITLRTDKISDGKIISFGRTDGTTFDGSSVYDGYSIDVSWTSGISGSIELYVSGELKERILNAGEYLVIARVADENNSFVGEYETKFTVNKRTLVLSDDETKYAEFLTTVYEKGKKERTHVFPATEQSAVSGAAETGSGRETPVVTLTFEFAKETAGKNVSVRIIDATTDDGNYEFAVKTKDFGAVGSILKKTIIVSVSDADENGIIEKSYSARKPVIDAGTYEIRIKWTFITDGAEATTYKKGTYEAIAAPENGEDEENYDVICDREYTLEIVPYTVTAENVVYRKTELEYNGTDLSEETETNAYFVVPFDSLNHSMELVFYTDAKGEKKTDEVINAGTYYVKGVSCDENYKIDENTELKKITVKKKNAGALTVEFKRENGELLQSGDTVTVEDLIYVDVSKDGYASGNDFDAKFETEGSGFKTVRYGDKWYVVPTIGGQGRAFTVKTRFATNYEDRKAAEFSVNVEKKAVYGILNKNTFVFGDRVTDEMLEGIEYYYIETIDGREIVGAKMNKSDIGGLEVPSINLGATGVNAKTYESVIFSGGGSDGYSFGFFTQTEQNEHGETVVSQKKSVTIVPKEITLVVNTVIGKTYGDGKDKEVIPYIITAVQNGSTVVLDTLPDGNAVVLKGSLGRASGEDVGEYELNKGTLNEENNPNYVIKTNFTSRFTISKKHVKIEVKPDQGKEYGESDGEIEFVLSDEEGNELVDSAELGITDTMDVFKQAIKCVREEGEDVGFYRYTLVTYEDKLRALNYEVDVADPSSLTYRIQQTTPQLYFEVEGFPSYGDKVDEIAYKVDVKDKYGNAVKGKISVYVFDMKAEGMRRNYILLGDDKLYAEFVPDEENYRTVSKTATITVGKRKTGVKAYYKNDGDLTSIGDYAVPYKGSAYSASDFTAEITDGVNLSDNETYNVTLEIKGESRNVTASGFEVVVSIESDYYELKGKTAFKVTVNKGLITAKVEDAVITEGEKFTAKITYDGLVGADKESAISILPTVKNLPDKAGYYSIKAEGGVAKNYEFVYTEGVLTINAKERLSDGGKIEGTLAPTYEISFTPLATSGTAFSETAKSTDSALGNKFYKPLTVAMKEYVVVKGSNSLGDGTYNYSIKFDGVTENSKIYVRLTSGEIEQVEFSVIEQDGEKYAAFASKEIAAAMRYETKTTVEMLKGYAILAIIAGVVLIILVIIIVVGVSNKKSKNKQKYYAVKSRWR